MDENQLNIPKKKSVALMFIISLITGRIYDLFWFIGLSDRLNNLGTQTKLKKTIPVISLLILIAVVLLSVVLYIFSVQLSGDNPVSDLSQIPMPFIVNLTFIALLSLLFIIFYLFMAFRTRKILNQALINKGEKVKISWFFTLIFSLFYLQYEINRIIDDKETKPRKGPWVCFIVILLLIVGSIIASILLGVSLMNSFSGLGI
ncbi:MAG: hypothetical protein WC796_01995 [Candidatus Pacearchaeota archaeon]|jgi:hypothetical protein